MHRKIALDFHLRKQKQNKIVFRVLPKETAKEVVKKKVQRNTKRQQRNPTNNHYNT